MTAMTSKQAARPRPPLREHPFFVNGALHGVPVPPALKHQSVIRAYAVNSDEAYVRTLWWSISGSFPFFVKLGTQVDDATALVRDMLAEGR